ncbi:hypothetical protein [Paraburkholderia rhynchosiae]|uniref:Uncharacterized protein n=1 Tax=Paraburkholderia rhynchosiae TaxID=487049 RepID=A0A2N7WT56_9BURK|nr:hypothetical protein [Paraburkholderia rhynchosiae]PMS32522.1 hypothetical protein C0Z16_07960 [Paraburkholderia rhynchosiae]CAB3673629.1 hypothetical protein LMG27174_02272 [Paraburkholderia rhynchosiae]
MKSFYVTAAAAAAAAVAVLFAGCSSTWSPANGQTVQRVPASTETRASRTVHGAALPEPASRPPVLSVGVSDPDTQLILPWFLADIVNAVNTHQSVGDLLHTMKNGL